MACAVLVDEGIVFIIRFVNIDRKLDLFGYPLSLESNNSSRSKQKLFFIIDEFGNGGAVNFVQYSTLDSKFERWLSVLFLKTRRIGFYHFVHDLSL